MTVTEELHIEEIRIGGIEEEVDTPAPLLEESSEQDADSPHSSSNPPSNANEEDEEDDDDMTVIVLEQGEDSDFYTPSAGWAEQGSPEMEERRRNILLRELQRVQRASFIHFLILCLIPTTLLLVVIATILGDDEECDSEATECEKEARTFINAFTTRCVCDAITVITGGAP
jgi:hypothetical protein